MLVTNTLSLLCTSSTLSNSRPHFHAIQSICCLKQPPGVALDNREFFFKPLVDHPPSSPSYDSSNLQFFCCAACHLEENCWYLTWLHSELQGLSQLIHISNNSFHFSDREKTWKKNVWDKMLTTKAKGLIEVQGEHSMGKLSKPGFTIHSPRRNA